MYTYIYIMENDFPIGQKNNLPQLQVLLYGKKKDEAMILVTSAYIENANFPVMQYSFKEIHHYRYHF